jgi:uncharacterized RDD family membrane protein YckC/disulfide oxidoreductase YuzD
MFNKLTTQKRIAITFIILAAINIAVELLPYNTTTIHIKPWILLIKLDWISHYGIYDDPAANPYNLVFYLLMLFGGIFYYRSKFKEFRLLRFTLSIIIFSRFLAITSVILHIILIKDFEINGPINIPLMLLFNGLSLWWIVLAYRTLIYLNSQKSLEIVVTDYGNFQTSVLKDASLLQRFLHLLIDSICIVLVFTPVIKSLLMANSIKAAFVFIESIAGREVGLLILAIIVRCIYYFLFERILNATPAKLFTETQVVDEDGTKPSISVIIGRTLSRFMFLESLSFLIGTGWHDKWSKTSVVVEKRDGEKARMYLLLIPILLIVLYSLTLLGKMLYNFQRDQITVQQTPPDTFKLTEEKKLNNLKIELLRYADQPTVNDYIEIKEPNNFSNDRTFLKVKKIYRDSVQYSIITVHDDYNISQMGVEDYYMQNKKNLKKVVFAKSKIISVINSMSNPPEEQVNLELDDKLYVISDIKSYYRPNIELSMVRGLSQTSLFFELRNTGRAAELIDIVVNKGDLQFLTSLINIKENFKNNQGEYFGLEANTKGKNDKCEFTFTIKDKAKNLYKYKLSGQFGNYNDQDWNLTRIN